MSFRTLPRALVGHAGAVLREIDPEMGRAMAAEAEHIEQADETLHFALGCVAAAYRRRLSAVTLAVIGARLTIALAAALFGVMHIMISAQNLCLKLELEDGGPGRCAIRSAAVLRYIDDTGLDRWVAMFVVWGGLGVLHIFAAAALAGGRTRTVYGLAVAIAIVGMASPRIGGAMASWAPTYVVLIGAMSLSAFLLQRAWRWETRRLSTGER